jgi:hypothetical protein
MRRKRVVKVLLSNEQRELLDLLRMRLGISQSEALRTAFMGYVKDLNLLSEKLKNNKLK